ncbi:hypothetical protein HDU91_003103 [Kappamyces sp. JEL0680]|nr:hypothetical protein HDU91_003103 [Kappamyces sp. JEL0680]
MRFKDTYKLPLPTKPKAVETGAKNSAGEHEKLRTSIATIRDSIEAAEKKYKDLVSLRKRQEANAGMKGMLQDPITIDELITKAKEELTRTKSRVQTKNEDKTRNDKQIEEKLQQGIAVTKEWFARKKLLMAAGPKFKRHSFSPFGDAFVVSAINKNTFIVITNRNSVEIWELDMDQPERPCVIMEAYELPGDPLTGALQLYIQEMDTEHDYLSNIPDQEAFLPGLKNVPYAKRTAWAPEPEQPEAKGYSDDIIEEEDEDEDQADASLPRYYALPPSHLYLKTLEDLGAICSARLPSWKEDKQLIDWVNYPFNDAPRLHYRSVFFCGTAAGNGMIVEVLSAYNPVEQRVTTACQVRIEKKISESSVKLSHFYFLNNGVPVIATEISTKTGERFVAGFTFELEVEWSCRCDIIRLSLADRCTRYVSKEQQLSLSDGEKRDAKPTDEYLITSYEFDSVHSCLLIGTGAGVLLRIFYNVDMKRGTPNRTEETKAGSPLKLVWCLEISAPKYTNRKDDLASLSPAEREAELLKKVKPEYLKVTSIRQILHPITNVSQLVIGVSDGVVRLYHNDNLKVTPKPMFYELDSLTRLDSLVIFDPDEADEVFIEVQILSHTIESGLPSRAKELPCSVRVLDAEKAICVVHRGRYWSIVSLQNTVQHRIEAIRLAREQKQKKIDEELEFRLQQQELKSL